MNYSNLLEIEKIINETGDYNAINDLITSFNDLKNIPGCFLMYRNDLYETFKSYHHHDIYELIYVVDGNVDFYIEEKNMNLQMVIWLLFHRTFYIN